MRFLLTVAGIVLFAWLTARALDVEHARAGMTGTTIGRPIPSLVVRSGSGEMPTATGAALGDRSLSGRERAGRLQAPRIPLSATQHQGKPLRWWVAKARQNKKDANKRQQTIFRLRAQVRSTLKYPTGHWLDGAFLCIHRFERHPHQGWQTNTGNGYDGGLQMDSSFERTYAPAWAIKAFGPDAHNWPASVQITTAIHAWTTRGFGPWPNTRRMCGL